MKPLPDWLVERAALDQVPPASRARLEHADPRELAARVAAIHADNATELAHHPAAPAVAQIERAAAQARQRTRHRQLRWIGVATGAAALLVVARLGTEPSAGHAPGRPTDEEVTRVKGGPRLIAFRQAGTQDEQLEPDAIVQPGDIIQLRYNAGGRGYGVIASLDGAGVVTLHFPASEDAQATQLPPETTALPHAYALDDAPRFERFFFITANDPVDVPLALAAVRALAQQGDGATAPLTLPPGLHQRSLRLRKPDPSSPNHESP